MRLLACADLHGMPERFARVRELLAEHAPEVLVLAGDLTGWDEVVTTLDRLRSPVPVVATSGNMDPPDTILELVRRGWLLTDELRTLAGVSFGGPNAQTPCDVLVVHRPPLGHLDRTPSGEHIGSRHTREILQRLRPRVLVCGHVHESPGVERAGETLVVNCSMGAGRAAGAVLDIDADRVDARLVP